MKEKESFTANIGRDKDISCEGRDVNVISFSYCSILGLGIRFLGAEEGLILISFDFVLCFWEEVGDVTLYW